MENLQAIWNILISEKERLSNMIVSSLLFIETFLYMLLFSTVLKLNSTKKQQILYVISFSVLALLSIIFIPFPFYTYVNIIMCPILIYFIFKTSILNSILAEAITYIVSLVLSVPLLTIYKYFLHISSTSVSAVPLYRITYTFSFFLFVRQTRRSSR